MGVDVVHPVPAGDAEPWFRAFTTTLLAMAFTQDSDARLKHWIGRWDADRTWGAREHGRYVATLATERRVLTVPGGGRPGREVATDALTAVTVAATHRRRGLLTQLMGQALEAAKERGDALSILVPAEWPIYGRYGYGAAVDRADLVYHPRRPLATLPAAPAGSVRSVDTAELSVLAPPIFDAARRLRAGQVDRPGGWWDRFLGRGAYDPIGRPYNWIVHEGGSGPDGFLGWKFTRGFELDGSLGAIEVIDFIAATAEAYRDLWAYLGGIDVVDEITLPARAIDEPVRWLLPDARALQVRGVGDFVWVRLLDVPAALSARGYATPGRLVLDVVDEGPGGYGAGRVLLDVDQGGDAICVPTAERADVSITARALASAYLGGHRIRQLALAGGAHESTSGVLDRLDLMFSTPLAPWCQTGF